MSWKRRSSRSKRGTDAALFSNVSHRRFPGRRYAVLALLLSTINFQPITLNQFPTSAEAAAGAGQYLCRDKAQRAQNRFPQKATKGTKFENCLLRSLLAPEFCLENLHSQVCPSADVLKVWLCDITKPFRKVEKPSSNIAKSFRNIAESFGKVAKSFGNIEKPSSKVAKSFGKVVKPFSNIEKSLRNIEKPFRKVTKAFRKVEKWFRKVEKALAKV